MACESPNLHVALSGVHGYGAFLIHALPAGALVGTYEGKRYSRKQLERQGWDNGLTFLFSLSSGDTIDGGRGGNATRHTNHSCVDFHPKLTPFFHLKLTPPIAV